MSGAPEYSRPEFGRPEFSRIVDIRGIELAPLVLSATAEECAALAKRFDLVAIRKLSAKVELERDGAVVTAAGRLNADIVQACAVSAEDLPVRIDQPLTLRFVPLGSAAATEEEIEIDSDSIDEIEYSDGRFDLGEAIAQSLALAIDPFLTGPQADAARQAAGIGDPGSSGPFAALSALRKP
jgi:uncharacterized metal-binding protein YceD (DUF177 family)